MGLDQYAYAHEKAKAERGDEQTEELAYWRKHPNLQGWMRSLWLHGVPATDAATRDFNCVELELKAHDLDELEIVVNGEELPETQGFFFGTSHPTYKEEDLAFIAKARTALAEGKRVFYNSWW